MNTCLLLGGGPNTGKSGAVHQVKDYLVKSRNFKMLAPDPEKIPKPPKDFCALLEGKGNEGKMIRIGLIGGTDSRKKMEKAANFFAKHSPEHGKPDFIVSTIRDDYQPDVNPNERDEFNEILGVLAGADRVEIPFGYVRSAPYHYKALEWYKEKMYLVIQAFLP